MSRLDDIDAEMRALDAQRDALKAQLRVLQAERDEEVAAAELAAMTPARRRALQRLAARGLASGEDVGTPGR